MAGRTNTNYHEVDKVNIKVKQMSQVGSGTNESYDVLSLTVTCSDGTEQSINLFSAFNSNIHINGVSI
tara:strand:+ start:253 stop:456 length:204 start_codon:yes stop_codon:yes gene_type:complete